MKCAVCKKSSEEVELFEGIYDAEMVKCCSTCSEREGIPLIKRPTKDQIEKSKESHTVRQRMDRLSGRGVSTPISADQVVVQSNLARLKMPDAKEIHPEIVDDYYWKVNIGRRRKKLSILQMSERTGVPVKVIEAIEKGKIPKDFEEVFIKLEEFLGEKLLKSDKKRILFSREIDTEKEILERVRKKMDSPKEENLNDYSEEEAEEDFVKTEKKEKRIESMKSGELDFSVRRNLENITLNDLIEMKRAKEKKEKKRLEESKQNSMMGDDIDLDIEEL